MPLRAIITEGTTADCTQAAALIENISADYLLADKAYDSNEILELTYSRGTESVIPPKRNRKQQREYDENLYRHRHLIENAFLHLKQWRGIATRYAKNASSFLAAIHIRCLTLWLNIS